MDQLHDSPTEDSILFVHWYVWIQYFCSFIINLPWNLLFYDFYHNDKTVVFSGVILILVIVIAILSLLTLSLCVIKLKKVWFLIEPVGVS